MIRADDVTLLTLKQLSSQYSRRAFSKLAGIRVEISGHAFEIRLRAVWHAPTYGGVRTMMVCPSCERPVFVLGVYGDRLGCRNCIGWKSEKRIRAA